jgi:hypothetical protein
MFASGEKTDETAPETEPPPSGWASDEKERVDLSRAARGAGSPVDGHRVRTDESTTSHDLNADDADQYADDTDERTDDADDHSDDVNGRDERDEDLDPDKSIYVPGKHPLITPADDAEARCDADIPAQDRDADDADSDRYFDEPYADPGGGGLTHKSLGVWRSSQ